jgi:hypothetical protein
MARRLALASAIAATLAIGATQAAAAPALKGVGVTAGERPAHQLVQWHGRPGLAWRGPGPRVAGPGWGHRHGHRAWHHRPYYGAVIGGVVLGTIIAATAYGLSPRPPRPDLCWYWADPSQSRGYWDYC